MFINKIRHKRDTFTSVNNAFRNEKGAIDLASIMVGIIVIGLIGGVIAATVFAVIPWAQDNAAKHQLDSVVQAENAYFGLSAAIPSPLPEGSPTNSFSNSAQLDNANLLIPGSRYCAVATDGGKHFAGYSQSASGKIFWATDTHTKPEHLADAISLPEACAYINKNYIDGTDIIPDPSEGSGNGSGDGAGNGGGSGGGNSSEDGYFDSDGNWIPYDKGQVPTTPTPPPTTFSNDTLALTYKCDADTTGRLGMNTNLQGVETWSDGTTQTYDPKFASTNIARDKTLLAGVEYEMVFEGSFTKLGLSTLAACLRSVDHIGPELGVTDLTAAFLNAKNLTDVPSQIPETIKGFIEMFSGATSFNDPDILDWKMTDATNINRMFRGATSFNQPIGSKPGTWQTGKVTDMQHMFNGATSFNQNLDNLDVKNVITMNHMFQGATSFNQPLTAEHWDTQKLTNIEGMFVNATSFNSPVTFYTGKVTQMSGIFSGIPIFNQDCSKWDTTSLQRGTTFAVSTFPTAYLPKGAKLTW